MQRNIRSSTLATVLLLSVVRAMAQEPASTLPPPRDLPYIGPITLEVDATDIDHRVLKIRETLPVRAGRLVLLYPKWIPGNHAPSNEVKRLAGLRVSAGGKPLPWVRDPSHLHAFQVDVPSGVSTIDVAFQQILPADGGTDTSLLSRNLVSIQWQGAVLAPAGFYASRIDVDVALTLPSGWQHASALRTTGTAGDPLRFARVSLETLVDSPVFAGRYAKRVELDPSGAPRPVVFSIFAEDRDSLEASDAQIDAHRRLVQQADLLFGARHFAHYDLMLMLSDDHPWAGLEHHQSSENGTKAGYFTDWAKFASVRDLLPHEFTHSWNGKFRRPRDLWAGDLNQPTRNSLLWVYEGQTEYWGMVLAARSGLIDLDTMRERFAWTAAGLQATVGRSWRPLRDTVHDEIIAGRHAPLDWYDWQRFEDYYDDGAMIWLDIDARIRGQSNGARSLDDFARGFFGVEEGRVAPLLYDFDDVTKALSRVQAADWRTHLNQRLDSLALSPLEGLERAGWRLAWTDQQSDYAKNAESYRDSERFTYSLGFGVGKKGDIKFVSWEGPAFKAGMAPGPTLLAVNMQEYKAETLRKAIDAAKTDPRPIELLLKDGTDYRLLRIDYHGGQRYPKLERIEGTPDLLTQILTAR